MAGEKLGTESGGNDKYRSKGKRQGESFCHGRGGTKDSKAHNEKKKGRTFQREAKDREGNGGTTRAYEGQRKV